MSLLSQSTFIQGYLGYIIILKMIVEKEEAMAGPELYLNFIKLHNKIKKPVEIFHLLAKLGSYKNSLRCKHCNSLMSTYLGKTVAFDLSHWRCRNASNSGAPRVAKASFLNGSYFRGKKMSMVMKIFYLFSTLSMNNREIKHKVKCSKNTVVHFVDQGRKILSTWLQLFQPILGKVPLLLPSDL